MEGFVGKPDKMSRDYPLQTSQKENSVFHEHHSGLSSLWRIFVDIDCNKREQTSCPVIGTEMQTNCNSEQSTSDRSCGLDFVYGMLRVART